ncbi:Phosphoribulokinase / Uridine kinase family protein [Histomonas meleagridis]|uniref:Phosphoribulokinase / Uridine kinase family protein n=1 Tax=Histomonas meleagridis TaxID=135588 RepID=UPI003559ACCA|nr:Phosphoribulokinase / Uridine kinase family protein [Histomonas meleagridis]KAH0799832.1 Phosphoribulokinase / Uridine kinase family protein [Histomonas meleagridis]
MEQQLQSQASLTAPSMEVFDFAIDKIHDPRNEKITRTQLLSEHAVSSFLLVSLYQKLYGRHLRIEHSLGDGFYYIDSTEEPITEQQIDEIRKEFTQLVNNDTPLELSTMPRAELIKYFKSIKCQDKVGVLKAWQDANIPIIRCGEFLDYVIEPMSTDKNRLTIFEIRKYEQGLLMRLPTMLNPTSIKEYKDPKVLHEMFSEYAAWAKLTNVDCVSKLNNAIYTGEIMKIKLVAEGLHEKKISKIASKLCKNFNSKRVITVAGPSSSNKTTFAKRLEIQLNVNGYEATVIEMDDYFQDTCKIPFGEDGLQDFEHISAMNLELLGQRVHELLEGKSIPRRKFNFKRGVGEDNPKQRLRLKPNAFLILEGIHGLNPELLKCLGTSNVTPIYVSALTPLNIDYNHRFPTSDLRLIRRIIRDHQFRGQSPRTTIRRWTSVRVGEERNIFPYQANAQLFFNSSMVYELPVLSIFGKVLLSEATEPSKDEDPDSPEAIETTNEARRLLGLLNFFYPLSPEVAPPTSCIREFIGNSELKY